MKIISLTAENIKRLVAVEIRPDGAMVQITGTNGSGKSSCLDSIWWAIAGARHIQSQPIRKGANHARIKLDMGEIIVTRTFQRDKEGEGYTTKLEVVGAVKGSPQMMLDSLLDSLAFDPLAFARMDAKAQFDALKKYVPDVDFDKITAANSIDFSERKDKNRRAKEERILADQIMIPDKAPTERIDETALVQKLTEAGKHNADILVRQENRKNLAVTIDKELAAIEELRSRVKALQDQAIALESKVGVMTKQLESAPPLPDPISVEALQTEIKNARDANMVVGLREKKDVHKKASEKFELEAADLTHKMAVRDAEKQKAVAGAKLPVEGLTFGEGIILLNSVPFEQASDAEQLKASCALAMAGNPQLRVIRVRDGSLLDEASLTLLAKMAEERDFQVWLEKVSEGKVGFVLEDGMVVSRPEESKPVEQAALPGVAE